MSLRGWRVQWRWLRARTLAKWRRWFRPGIEHASPFRSRPRAFFAFLASGWRMLSRPGQNASHFCSRDEIGYVADHRMDEAHRIIVGETAPDFSLPDSTGTPRRLSEL